MTNDLKKNEELKAPQLRFKGFTQKWEQRKLGEIAKTTIGEFVIKSKQHSDNEYPVYNGGTSYTGFYDAYNNEPNKVVISARGANAGFVNLVKTKYWAGNSCYSVGILDENEYDVDYLYQFIKHAQHLFTDYQQAANIPSVSKKDVETFNISAPSFDEQKSIGSFLTKIDKTITLHQQKVDLLKKQKNFFLQKLFPNNGEAIPRIRFSGFSDEWEQRKLGEIAKTTIGEFVIKSKQHSDNEYPVYNGGTSYTGFYDAYNNEPNKVVISARGANAGFVNLVKTKYWAGNSCYSVGILDENEYDVDYLYQFIKHAQHLFTDYQQAANIPSVSKKDVETFNISAPSFDEQKSIGSFLTKIDKTITLHQSKLDNLKKLKQSLLQKMFI